MFFSPSYRRKIHWFGRLSRTVDVIAEAYSKIYSGLAWLLQCSVFGFFIRLVLEIKFSKNYFCLFGFSVLNVYVSVYLYFRLLYLYAHVWIRMFVDAVYFRMCLCAFVPFVQFIYVQATIIFCFVFYIYFCQLYICVDNTYMFPCLCLCQYL